MKILLVQPVKPAKALGGEDFAIYEPLALEYLAAGVAGDHDVRILDMRIDYDLDSQLRQYRPDACCNYIIYGHVNTVKAFSANQDFGPGTLSPLSAGHHATIIPEDFCTPFIDRR